MVKLGWTDNFESKFKKSWGDFPELDSWVNNLYQDKTFTTREAYNKAYDEYCATNGANVSTFRRGKKAVIFTHEDLQRFEYEIEQEEFEDNYVELIQKIKSLFECGKIVFFY
jgi:hypothetical protein